MIDWQQWADKGDTRRQELTRASEMLGALEPEAGGHAASTRRATNIGMLDNGR